MMFVTGCPACNTVDAIVINEGNLNGVSIVCTACAVVFGYYRCYGPHRGVRMYLDRITKRTHRGCDECRMDRNPDAEGLGSIDDIGHINAILLF